MQARRSTDLGDDRAPHRRSNSWSLRSPLGGPSSPRAVLSHPNGNGSAPPASHLVHSYDADAHGLSDLAEDSDEDDGSGSGGRTRASFALVGSPPR